MRKAPLLIISVLILASCATLMPKRKYTQALAKASAQKWSSGAKGGDRGVTFRVRFYQINDELMADTLYVNNVPLSTEITQVGDTTYVTSFFYTSRTEERTLANDAEYTGKLRVTIDEKKHFIPIDRFVMDAQELRP